MAFTINKALFYNSESFDELTHSYGLAMGVQSFVARGFDIKGTTITAGAFTNHGTFGQFGANGETMSITPNFTGYISIKTTLNGRDSKHELLLDQTNYNETHDFWDPENPIKIYTIYKMKDGVVEKDGDYRNLSLWGTIQEFQPIMDDIKQTVDAVYDQVSSIIEGDGDPSVLSLRESGYNDIIYGGGEFYDSFHFEETTKMQYGTVGQYANLTTEISGTAYDSDATRATIGVSPIQEFNAKFTIDDSIYKGFHAHTETAEPFFQMTLTNTISKYLSITVDIETETGDIYQRDIPVNDGISEFYWYSSTDTANKTTLDIYMPAGQTMFEYIQSQLPDDASNVVVVKINMNSFQAGKLDNISAGDIAISTNTKFKNWATEFDVNVDVIKSDKEMPNLPLDVILWNWHKNAVKKRFDALDRLKEYPALENAVKQRLNLVGELVFDIRMTDNHSGTIVITDTKNDKQYTLISKPNVQEVRKNGDYFTYDTSNYLSLSSNEIFNLFDKEMFYNEPQLTFDSVVLMIYALVVQKYGINARGDLTIWVQARSFSDSDSHYDWISKNIGNVLKRTVGQSSTGVSAPGTGTYDCSIQFKLPQNYATPQEFSIIINNNAQVYSNITDNFGVYLPGNKPANYTAEELMELAMYEWGRRNASGFVRKKVQK